MELRRQRAAEFDKAKQERLIEHYKEIKYSGKAADMKEQVCGRGRPWGGAGMEEQVGGRGRPGGGAGMKEQGAGRI